MKIFQIVNENDKKPIFFYFQWLHAFFPTFMTDFVYCNVGKCQQGKHALSILLRKEVNADLQTKNVRN